MEGDVGLPGRHVPEPAVEEALERLPLRETAEPSHRREGEPRQAGPLDVEVVLRPPHQRELRHLVGGQPGGPHCPPHGRAGARRYRRGTDAGLLERARHPDQRHARSAAARAHHAHALAAESGRRPASERRQDVRRRRLRAVDERQREERAAGVEEEPEVGGGGSRDVVARAADPLQHALDVEGIERVEDHGRS